MLELKALKQAFDKEMIPYGIFSNVFDSLIFCFDNMNIF